MPSEWFETTLGEFCPLTYGKGLPERARDSRGAVRVYGSNGVVGMHSEPYVVEPGVVVGRKGTVGAVHYSAQPFWPIDTTFYITGGPQRDIRFTYYLLRSLPLEHLNSDSAVPGLNRDAAHSVEVRVPDIATQQRIASILGSLDDKIELNRRMNRTLERMAQALFKAWFIDFDPVRAKAEGDPTAGGLPDHLAALFPDRLADSELGPIPEGWEVQALDEIAHYLNGLACQKYPPVEGRKSLPVIKIRDLRQGITANSDRATAEVPTKYIVEDGDILFSWSGSLLVTIWCNGRGVLNQHVFKVTSGKYPKWYFYHATKHHLEEFQRIAADKATTMGHIQRHHLSSAKLAVPPDEHLNAATEVLGTAIDRRINALKQARTLSSMRDTLLPKLLSGELLATNALVEEVMDG